MYSNTMQSNLFKVACKLIDKLLHKFRQENLSTLVTLAFKSIKRNEKDN